MKEQEKTERGARGNHAWCLRGQETDPEPSWNEEKHHGLPSARPEIVSGNRGAFPALALGPAGR